MIINKCKLSFIIQSICDFEKFKPFMRQAAYHFLENVLVMSLLIMTLFY